VSPTLSSEVGNRENKGKVITVEAVEALTIERD
jgi:hypothetical protein